MEVPKVWVPPRLTRNRYAACAMHHLLRLTTCSASAQRERSAARACAFSPQLELSIESLQTKQHPITMHFTHGALLQLRLLQKEHDKLAAVLAARDQELVALREIAESASQLQSQDAQAAKVRASLS